MIEKLKNKLTDPWSYGLIIIVLLLIRAFFNGIIPLMDRTEARYSEIARIMAETRNWIVLQIDYGIPFWAKPPLSTWLSASSISLFGANAFAVRLPYLIIAVIMIFWVGKYAPKEKGAYFIPGIILLTLPEFFIHAGLVSTDVMLSFSVALVMLSFWELITKEGRSRWSYLFFAGIGLGLLAKGPIIGVLTFPPLVIWCVWFRISLKRIFRIPWLIGVLIIALLTLPWYYLAEVNSPGFIDYFIVEEHFRRFFDSGWKGDKYGFPKSQPMGMIWLFLFLFALPWIQIVFYKTVKGYKKLRPDKWRMFLLFWLLWTPFFFTPSKSLIHPYTLPVMVPVALLVASWWPVLKYKAAYLAISLSLPLIVTVVYFTGVMDPVFASYSDKYLIEQHVSSSRDSLYALKKKSYSGQFYTHGTLKIISHEELKQKNLQKESFSIIITHKNYKKMPQDLKDELELIDSNPKNGIYKRKE